MPVNFRSLQSPALRSYLRCRSTLPCGLARELQLRWEKNLNVLSERQHRCLNFASAFCLLRFSRWYRPWLTATLLLTGTPTAPRDGSIVCGTRGRSTGAAIQPVGHVSDVRSCGVHPIPNGMREDQNLLCCRTPLCSALQSKMCLAAKDWRCGNEEAPLSGIHPLDL